MKQDDLSLVVTLPWVQQAFGTTERHKVKENRTPTRAENTQSRHCLHPTVPRPLAPDTGADSYRIYSTAVLRGDRGDRRGAVATVETDIGR